MSVNGQRFLEGIKVLDVASFIAGPAAATVMADFGAEVIKVEPPGIGDAYRYSWKAPGSPACASNYPWLLDNRTKKSIAINLKTAAGQAVLHRLAADADVFLTNIPLGRRAALKVRYEDIAPLNERLIYASLTAYGETGAEAGKTGFDSTALWARTGLMDMVRPSPDSPPARSLPGMGDHPTAMSLFGAIMAGLYQRERTGKGTMVATSLVANGVWWNATPIQATLCGAEYPRRPAREHATNALHNLYQCRDGQWFHLVLIPEDKNWTVLCPVLNREDLLTDPRFATREARHANAPALIETLDAVFRQRDWPEWRARLEAAGLTFGVIARLADIPHDQQLLDADILTPIADPTSGPALTVNSPISIGGQHKVAPQAAPDLGQHTDAVLRDVGYSATEIAELRALGAIW
jgi:crotonobetainyl-CoA:carnitine CoA-transferase CaiB-like acyl-CoA transferase